MGFGEYVRINANCEAGAHAESFGTCGKKVNFSFRLDVEEQDVSLECSVNLPCLLADTGEHDAPKRRFRCPAYALKLSSGDDVESSAEFRQHAQQCDRGIGLDGVADCGPSALEGLLEQCKTLPDLCAGINIQGSAMCFGKLGKRHVFAQQLSVPIPERPRPG